MVESCQIVTYSHIKELILGLGDPSRKSLEQICSEIGEPQITYAGDPVYCLPNSLSCVWNVADHKITMYFDHERICFGADLNHILLPLFGTDIHLKQEVVKLLDIFI